MDRLDMENWEKDNLFIFSFENNLKIIPINLKWNFKFYYWKKSAIFISQDAKWKMFSEVTLLLLSDIGDPFWWAIYTYISSELLEESED